MVIMGSVVHFYNINGQSCFFSHNAESGIIISFKNLPSLQPRALKELIKGREQSSGRAAGILRLRRYEQDVEWCGLCWSRGPWARWNPKRSLRCFNGLSAWPFHSRPLQVQLIDYAPICTHTLQWARKLCHAISEDPSGVHCSQDPCVCLTCLQRLTQHVAARPVLRKCDCSLTRWSTPSSAVHHPPTGGWCWSVLIGVTAMEIPEQSGSLGTVTV